MIIFCVFLLNLCLWWIGACALTPIYRMTDIYILFTTKNLAPSSEIIIRYLKMELSLPNLVNESINIEVIRLISA